MGQSVQHNRSLWVYKNALVFLVPDPFRWKVWELVEDNWAGGGEFIATRMGHNDFVSVEDEEQHRTWRGNTSDLRKYRKGTGINDLCLSEPPPGAFLTKENALARLSQTVARALSLTVRSSNTYYQDAITIPLNLAEKSVRNSG